MYDTFRVQDFIILQPDLEEAFSQFNTLFSNNFIKDVTARKVSIIPMEMNRTAQYMALFEVNNMNSFVQAHGIFGDLQSFLNRDLGMELPHPKFKPVGELW